MGVACEGGREEEEEGVQGTFVQPQVSLDGRGMRGGEGGREEEEEGVQGTFVQPQVSLDGRGMRGGRGREGGGRGRSAGDLCTTSSESWWAWHAREGGRRKRKECRGPLYNLK